MWASGLVGSTPLVLRVWWESAKSMKALNFQTAWKKWRQAIVRGQGNGQEGEDGRKTDRGRGVGESGEKRADMSLFNSHRVSLLLNYTWSKQWRRFSPRRESGPIIFRVDNEGSASMIHQPNGENLTAKASFFLAEILTLLLPRFSEDPYL